MIEILLPYLVGSLALNIFLFLIAFKLQSDKLTDASYALTFIAIAISVFITTTHTIYGGVALSMILLWAIRIGGFLLYRVIRTGKDARFDAMRSHFLKFGQFWVLQGLSVWVLMVPFILALQNETAGFSSWAIIGLIIWAVGLVIETVADTQKIRFTSNEKNINKWIESGIWKYSRHPNYFGEILVWMGVYVYTLQVLSGLEVLVATISPVFIGCLLLFVSGIPILEKNANAKWGSDKQYISYKKRTSILIPFFSLRKRG